MLELCGEGALEAASRLGGGVDLRAGRLRLMRLHEGEEDLDEALCVVLGPERLELHLHGSPVLVARVLEALGGAAFEETSSDHLKELASERLAGARTEVAARVLLDQAQGSLCSRLSELAGMDESAARVGLAELVERSALKAPLLSAPRVVLAGPVNAGKSTLFNALVGSGRAITSDEPGTTRDMLVGYASLGEVEYEFIDTAGVREVSGESGEEAVEREGQRAAELLRAGAHAVFWVEEVGAPLGEPPAGCEVLRSKADLHSEPPEGAVSALHDPAGAREELARRLAGDAPSWTPGEPVLFSDELRAWAEDVLAGPLDSLCVKLREMCER